MTARTFEFSGMWLAKDGDTIAFGNSIDQVTAAVEDPRSHEELIVHFSEDEWRILAEFILATENKPVELGELSTSLAPRMPRPSDPLEGTYAVLSPAGRKYGTWGIIKQSTRNPSTWDITMPGAGSESTAQRLALILNGIGSQKGNN